MTRKEIISFVIQAVATLKSYLSKRQKDEGVQMMKQSLKDALENRYLNDKINIQNEKKKNSDLQQQFTHISNLSFLMM